MVFFFLGGCHTTANWQYVALHMSPRETAVKQKPKKDNFMYIYNSDTVSMSLRTVYELTFFYIFSIHLFLLWATGLETILWLDSFSHTHTHTHKRMHVHVHTHTHRVHIKTYTLVFGNTLRHTHTHTEQNDPIGKAALSKMALLTKWHSANWYVERVIRLALSKVVLCKLACSHGYIHAILFETL